MKLISEHPFVSAQSGLTVRLHRLDNGLQVLLLRDPAAPIFAYQTWFRVGSRHEREGKTGIAHLFEHLMFNQTEHLQPGEFDRLMETAGGQTNAATWVDWTYYQDDLPAADLPLVVRLEADRMQHLTIQPHQVESEREVVINERRLRVEDDVEGFLSEELFRLAFTQHPYRWPTIGWMRDIKALSLDDCRHFYRTFYAPNNATIVLVGDFEEAQALDLIGGHFGKIPAAVLPEPPSLVEPLQTEERRASYEKPIATERLVLGYKAPAHNDPQHLHLRLLSSVLMGSASAALYRELVIQREIASSLSGSVTPFKDPGLWEISVSLRRGHSAQEALSVIESHLQRGSERPVAEAELARAKALSLTRFYLDLRTAHGKAESLGHYETTGGDYRLLFQVAEATAKVTPEDLLAVARTLSPTRRTVLMATPLPDGEDGGDDDEGDGGGGSDDEAPRGALNRRARGGAEVRP